MIAEEVIPDLNESTTLLLREIARFSSSAFNKPAGGGDWSAGQVAEHILLTDIFIFRVLQDNPEFAGRAADEKVGGIRNMFQDQEIKLNSPDFTIPSDMTKDPLSLQDKIRRERHLIINFLSTVEEEGLCTAYEHPDLGTLTITEWIWYIVYHTERHVGQLMKMEVEE